jgi:hypothetical protein
VNFVSFSTDRNALGREPSTRLTSPDFKMIHTTGTTRIKNIKRMRGGK